MDDEQFTFKLLQGFTWNDVSALERRGYLTNKVTEPAVGINAYQVAKPFYLNGQYQPGDTFID